jgi:alkylresorcinol/alkylpyrone synthase
MPQAAAKAFAASFFKDAFKDLERLLPIFDHTQIYNRYLSRPLEWYEQPHSFTETNSLYEETALALALQAATVALQRAALTPAEVGLVLFVSNTGLATPSLDSTLIQALGLSSHTRRLPIWGLGCAGGVAGLARAADLSRTLAGRAVLLVAVELCTLTFQHNDRSKANLIAASLFGDGAAAAVLTLDGDGPEILSSYRHLFDGSAGIMGWDLVPSGLKVRFSRDIPGLVRKHLPRLLERACRDWGIDRAALRHYVVHPGGAKVLAAYRESLGLAVEDLCHAYAILAEYGNMSSASVLFVLEDFLVSQPQTGDYGLMLALGPGFSAEKVLFRW